MENLHNEHQEPNLEAAAEIAETAQETMPGAISESNAEKGIEPNIIDASDLAPKKKNRKLWIILGVIIIALLAITVTRLAGALGPATVAETTPVNVKIATVETQSIYATSPLTGRIQAADEVAVIPLASGKVTSVRVSIGDYVEKGAILLEIDKTQMSNSLNQSQAGIQQSQAGVQQAQVGVQQAQIGYDQAKMALDNATTTYNSTKALYEAGAVSLQQYQQVELQYNNAVQGIASAQEAINAAKAAVKSAESAVATAQAGASSAREGLSNCTVTAPISGYVTSVSVSVGSIAGQTSPVVTLSNTSDLEINTTLSEYLVTKVAQGDAVEVYISTLSETPFNGTIKALSPAPAMGTLTYPVTIAVEDPEGVIKAGMFAETQIVSDKKENVIAVPSSAVIVKSGKSRVAVLDKDNIPTLVEVSTGIDNGELVEITSGLSGGETIVISGQDYVTEGLAVNVIQ